MSDAPDYRTITLYRAGAVRDAGVHAGDPEALDERPGAVAVRDGVIVASGRTEEVERAIKDQGPVRRVELPDRLLLPALVNAHAHLDLTDIGPVPYGGDFIGWIEMVIARRPRTPEAIRAAVLKGLRMSRAAGVGALGDIAGSEEAARARVEADAATWLGGTTYLECLGRGAAAVRAAQSSADLARQLMSESLEESHGHMLRIDLQPHAPYSTDDAVFELAHDRRLGRPCTHLAETMAEEQFVRDADGPFADFLRRLGKWSAEILPRRQSPVQAMEKYLARASWLVVHCNYVSDADIAILAKTSASVAYCPIASEYFGHRNHRYRDMRAAGVNVCLGTDSILCQPPDDPQPLGILPALRRLHRRDGTDPRVLLEMATWCGASGLGFDGAESTPSLRIGAAARMVAVKVDPGDSTDPLSQVLLNSAPSEAIFG